ncbi:hypothetical protein TZ03_20470 [Pseudomonas sp. 10-1B]|nr:hypothetical protein TZ03_20470 [Pseudomonas sp. 10-1B]
MLLGQNPLQSCIQQLLINRLEAKARIERRIPWHFGKRGQSQFIGPSLARCIGHLLQQPAPDTLPLSLPAYRKLVKVQRLPLKPGTGKPQNAPIWPLSHPAATRLDKCLVGVAVHHIAVRQPCQCRPGGKGLGSRAFDVREPLDVVLKSRANVHEEILSF